MYEKSSKKFTGEDISGIGASEPCIAGVYFKVYRIQCLWNEFYFGIKMGKHVLRCSVMRETIILDTPTMESQADRT